MTISYTALNQYIEHFLTVSSPRGASLLLSNFEELGVLVQGGGGKNGVEAALVRLIDKLPMGKRLSILELRTLLVYHTLMASRHVTLGEGGEIIDQWVSGVDHNQAAVALGISGHNPGVRSRKRYVKLLTRIGVRV